MNLYLFPEAACQINGYGIAVNAAYKRLDIKEDDVVVWVSSFSRDKILHLREQDHILKRPDFFSIRSVINTINRTNRSELPIRDFSFLKGQNFDKIYCDETCFYHPIRKLFPNNKLIIRFHNCFARIHDRLNLLSRDVDFLFKWTLYNMYHLEREIMNDRNVYKIFITEEDRQYYISNYGIVSDSETFHFDIDYEKLKEIRKECSLDHRLIWFGGVESHKKSSIEWFISDVIPIIRQSIPDIQFHLWGRYTEQFNNERFGIFGHGFYQGNDMPSRNSLYVNPDIIGGGIKIKLMSLLKSGVPIISTPFGFEGYSHDLIDNEFCIVQEENKWAYFIIKYLQTHSNLN